MVSVWEPLAYEPPTSETLAELLPSDTSWNIGFAAGNAAPLETDSETPFTAMTADGGGAVGGAGGALGRGGGRRLRRGGPTAPPPAAAAGRGAAAARLAAPRRRAAGGGRRGRAARV